MPNHDHAFSDDDFKISTIRAGEVVVGDILVGADLTEPTVSLVLYVEPDADDEERIMLSMIVCDAGEMTRGAVQVGCVSFDALDVVGKMVSE